MIRTAVRDWQRPSAVLLDHGGVIVRSRKRPEAIGEVADLVAERLDRAGAVTLPVERIADDLAAAQAAYKAWKNGNGRGRTVPELSHRDYWLDLVAADWPTAARAYVAAEATPLCRALVEAASSKQLGPGMVELLDWCRDAAIRLGIVSNTLLGDVNRTLARQWGTLDHFAVQVHSDEVGIRKPDPEMILIATRALGIEPAQAWFVGDNYDKDVLCARRAGVGVSVLMRPPADRDPQADPQPDLNVTDGFELRDVLAASRDQQKEGAA